MSLSGKVALVTGGSRGIGKAIAKLFLEEGAKVAITGRDTDRLELVRKELGGVLTIPADMRNERKIQSAVEKVIEKFGRLDILVNNAGIFPQIKLLHQIRESEWNDVIDVNLTGQFRFTKRRQFHIYKKTTDA